VPVAIPPEVVVIRAEHDVRTPDVLVASCSATLGRGRCRAGSEEKKEPSVWYAVVAWLDDEHLSARVQFRREGELWAQRDVEFNATDSAEQRERALGLIVAAYAMGTQASAPEEPVEDTPAPTPVPATKPAPSKPDIVSPPRDEGPSDDSKNAPSRYGVDTGVFLGPGLDRGASRVGLLLRPWLRPSDAPLMGLVQVRGAMRPDDPLVTWLSASLGLGARLEPDASLVAVEAHLEAVGERWIASAEDSTGARESKGVFRFGARLGAELQIPQRTPVSGFVGVEGAFLRPKVDVAVADQTVGSEPPATWAVLLGLRTSY
jgi:hypothetical protein